MKLSPSILTDSFITLQEQVNIARESDLIETVQVDIVDGQFADNITVTPLDLAVGDFEPLKIDFHFMVEEPMDYVYECVGIKEYLPIHRIYGQIERMSFQKEFVAEVKKNNWQVGLALDLFTPVEEIDEELWSEIDGVLLMAVEAGFQEEKFNPLVLEKIREVKKIQASLSGKKFHIMADGGIELSNVQQVLAAGADEIAVGSEIWKSNDPLRTVEEFFKLEGSE